MNVRISKGASFRIPFREDDLLFQGAYQPLPPLLRRSLTEKIVFGGNGEPLFSSSTFFYPFLSLSPCVHRKIAFALSLS